jgi:hypothetical protein
MRVVHGGRGNYVEMSEDQIKKKNLHVPEDKKWKLETDRKYYIEYRTPDLVKIYFQTGYVGYADYQLGYYYVDPLEVTIGRDSRFGLAIYFPATYFPEAVSCPICRSKKVQVWDAKDLPYYLSVRCYVCNKDYRIHKGEYYWQKHEGFQPKIDQWLAAI